MDPDFWSSYCKIGGDFLKTWWWKWKLWFCHNCDRQLELCSEFWDRAKFDAFLPKKKTCYTNITGPSFFPSEMQGNKLSLFLPQQFKGVDMLIRKAIKPICIPCKLVFCNWFVLGFQTQIKLLMTRISLETKISQARFSAHLAEVKKYKLENNGRYWAR